MGTTEHRIMRAFAYLAKVEGVDVSALECAVDSALQMRLGESAVMTDGELSEDDKRLMDLAFRLPA